MAEDVNLPKLGKMNKKVVLPVVGVAAAYVGYRYWKARSTPADLSEDDPAYEDAGTLPGVAGAVKPDNSYGGGTGGNGGSNDDDITTNSQWTRYAIQELAGSGRWDSGDVASALGNYLDRQPLTDDQATIVRAAIGVAGNPPVGTYYVVPGGNTGLTVAPTGVVATGITSTSATISFTPVPGATSYQVYLSGRTSAVAVGNSSPIKIDGLTAGTKYSVQVAGVNKAGTVGPKSSAAGFSTSAAVATQPSQPTIKSVTKSTVTVSSGITNSTGIVGYRWNLNGRFANQTTSPVATLTRLSPNTAYSVTVQSVTNSGKFSDQSRARSFRTKK